MSTADMRELKQEWTFRVPFSGRFFLWCLFVLFFRTNVVLGSGKNCIKIHNYTEYVTNTSASGIFCSTDGSFSSDHLTFMRGGELQKFTKMNYTTIKLNKIGEPARGKNYVTYACKSNYEHCSKALSTTVYVTLEKPRKVSSFTCVWENLEYLHCSWYSLDNIRTTYNVSYSDSETRFTGQIAQIDLQNNNRFCEWKTSIDLPYKSVRNFTFYIRSNNSVGNRTEELTVFDHYSIAKLAPVNITKTTVRAYEVELEWKVHENLVKEYLGKTKYDFKIECDMIDSANKVSHVTTDRHYDDTLSEDNKLVTLTLSNLPYAQMQYKIRVYIKVDRANDDFWSEPSEITVSTASDIPRRPPELPLGSFYQTKYDSYRQIYIYWKQLEANEEAGANFNYIVEVKSENDNKFIKTTGGYLELKDATLNEIKVFIWSENEKGKSVKNSHLYIPSVSSPSVKSFTKHVYSNDTYKLSWLKVNDVDNYTIIWCPYNAKHNCDDRMDYSVVGPLDTSFYIAPSSNKLYQFAISANKRGITKGLTWTACETHESLGLSGFDFKFEGCTDVGKTSVILHWSLNCILEQNYFYGYSINYCPKGIPSINCSTNYEYVNSSSQTMLTQVDKLDPYTNYVFTMKLDTVHGFKLLSQKTEVTTLADTPSQPRNLRISKAMNDSLELDLDPPRPLNGNPSDIRYEVFNDGKLMVYSFKIPVTMNNLNSFTNYSLSVQACNVAITSCSNKTKSILGTTRIGKPGKLETPTYETKGHNKFLFKWREPQIRAGNVDFYQVKISMDTKPVLHEVGKELVLVSEPCSNDVDNIGFRVRAVNNDSEGYDQFMSKNESLSDAKLHENVPTLFYGDWSEEIFVPCEKPADFTLLYIFLCVLGIIIVVFAVRKYLQMMKAKKDIYPVFAQGLLSTNINLTSPAATEERSFINKIWLLICKKSNTNINTLDSVKPLISTDTQKDNTLFNNRISFTTTSQSLITDENTKSTCVSGDNESKEHNNVSQVNNIVPLTAMFNHHRKPKSNNPSTDIQSKKLLEIISPTDPRITNMRYLTTVPLVLKNMNKTKSSPPPPSSSKPPSALVNQEILRDTDSILDNLNIMPECQNKKLNLKVPISKTSTLSFEQNKIVLNPKTGYVQTDVQSTSNPTSQILCSSEPNKGYVKAAPILIEIDANSTDKHFKANSEKASNGFAENSQKPCFGQEYEVNTPQSDLTFHINNKSIQASRINSIDHLTNSTFDKFNHATNSVLNKSFPSLSECYSSGYVKAVPFDKDNDSDIRHKNNRRKSQGETSHKLSDKTTKSCLEFNQEISNVVPPIKSKETSKIRDNKEFLDVLKIRDSEWSSVEDMGEFETDLEAKNLAINTNKFNQSLTGSGYVRPEDVINKQLNIMTGTSPLYTS